MYRTAFFGMIIIFISFVFFGCDNEGSNGNNNTGISLSGTTWELPESSSSPAGMAGTGGLRLIFINNTQWRETSILKSSIEYANGTYVITGNTVTLTTANFWNGSSLYPHVRSWTSKIEGNKMSYEENGELYIFTKK